MEESRPRRAQPAPARIRPVPIAVTPEGFWCCPRRRRCTKPQNPHHHHGHGAGNNSHGHGHSKQQRKIPSAPRPWRPPKLSDSDNGHGGSPVPCVEIHDCDDAEIYVETVGLMYCDEAKHKLLKQNVSRVLRIMKVAELLGFHACVKSCLDYLEAVPWVGIQQKFNNDLDSGVSVSTKFSAKHELGQLPHMVQWSLLG
ncbi:hypothetical protein ZWY2020_058111 [Hordeum vulgare]|nr:hypothetical protein ZWY2020_058111 [Hordeum vulgare]